MHTDVALRFIDLAFLIALAAVFYLWTTRLGARMRKYRVRLERLERRERARRVTDHYGNGRLPADAFDKERAA